MSSVMRQQGIRLAIASVVTLGLIGCFGMTQNPSHFPYLLPTGDIIRTHAKPPGKGYFSDFDPAAKRLMVTPEQSFQPIGTHQVFIATVLDADGKPRRKRRVEWILEGEGSIIEVDESGYFAGRGYKHDNRYAVSYTDYTEHRISRGNSDPSDDFTILPGQTWCVVSSAVPGQTSLTVYAPEIHNWENHKVIVRTMWVDAICEFPPDAAVRVGTDQILSTRVLRKADQRPLPGYRVRYSIVEGSPTQLVGNAANIKEPGPGVFETVSDQSGLATIRLAQRTQGSSKAEPGQTMLRIEVIREADGVVVGMAERKIEWQGAQLKLALSTPRSASLNDDVSMTLSVLNVGQVSSTPATLRMFVPAGVQVLGTLPATRQEGNQLLWELPSIPGQGQEMIHVKVKPTKPGPMKFDVVANANNNDMAKISESVEVLQARIQMSREGPTVGVVGEEIPIRIKVANTGTGPVTDIEVQCKYDPGLTHTSQKNPAVAKIAKLEPGQIEDLIIRLRANDVGKHNIRFFARAANSLTAETDPLAIDVRKAGLMLTSEATPRAYLQQEIAWQIRVKNDGELPLTNVLVRGEWPDEVVYLRANLDGKTGKNVTQWVLGELKPGEERTVVASGRAMKLTPNATLRAIVTADPLMTPGAPARPAKLDGTGQITKQMDRTVEVLGVPSVQVEVKDRDDPLTVGQRTTYTITVKNTGTLAATGIQIVANVPPQMRAVRGSGPTEGRNEGNLVQFGTIDQLPPNQQATFQVEVEATAAGDARFRVEARGPTLNQPVKVEEATRILPATGR
ncbi:COG1361 family protein [Tuwongella immobilis]|uniref:DUF11 domain-containing protein n=1 Tax=Tuwongella immobilis TaxID=692036 RepID=A0A6C2YMM3_9BACT|nr:DUF11 domain-containing protein [Tuwongella immobilis]VIP02617.1 repeat domain protein : Conserved repeat domain protein OS=Pirellula staleyi (strain ATCC 27377 / DSM 6068 / ICPB 4128) GN=Psta_2103 PE=4 SV=1: CARDB: DUF11 [Tuwongella immobilis]VTS01939.1 repeat domain protein : Conserved repeat domain protein OS=Pirellula staleyi (strain ATCC 27377 / DSM 6068 / ICPB 4128) GN=Psta_2103 PE=4 SV=1: CARDB: DUF11 [Tuwongella immobilis]